ncbi:ABC transporter permease [Paenibacillus albiflavus]|uniref:ABC transporter permease n=1 Tax=Paenibacillus albiflavus TaxID=2545760 RepID=A0A4R4EJ25_9BACL|nr:ABC transporter permease [Paenibacillus albiflavus]TCZ80174.1 ABC transporter permease [Paenibacillus albiflavus]
MLSKLSLRNVKRSLKDYTIYFVTLTFAVCIFYVFNSIESQQVMLDVTAGQASIFDTLTMVMGYFSFFVSIILGFLIIYANNFLIKRRKKELAIYMILGMEKKSISKILIVETLTIGIISLAVGLSLGVLLSQGLAVVTAKMFAVNMKSFHFVFSLQALLKSILYFGVMFLFVIVFNSVSISKYKLIDLLHARRKNETSSSLKLWVSVFIFIVSVACLGAAYYLILNNGMMTFNNEFKLSVLLGGVGTFLFFFSLSGFLLKIAQSNKKLYLRELNMFILRQINSKIRTTYISITIICLMLFVAITTLSVGMGMSSVMTKDVEAVTPFDATLTFTKSDKVKQLNVEETLSKANVDLSTITKESLSVNYYHVHDISYRSLIIGGTEKFNNPYQLEKIENSSPELISLSDYNKLLVMQGLQPVTLSEHQFAINANFEDMQTVLNFFLHSKGTLTIGQVELKAVTAEVMDHTLETTTLRTDYGTIVVPDHIAQTLEPVKMQLSLNYPESSDFYEQMYQQEMSKMFVGPSFFSMSKAEAFDKSLGVKTVIAYLAIYIGIVFLITSVAILALQQLSESTDNLERYHLLKKIGVEQQMIHRSVFTQIEIYFLMPLALAIVHSIVAINAANQVIFQFGSMDISTDTIITALSILVIYAGYFFATYLGSINMIKDKK